MVVIQALDLGARWPPERDEAEPRIAVIGDKSALALLISSGQAVVFLEDPLHRDIKPYGMTGQWG